MITERLPAPSHNSMAQTMFSVSRLKRQLQARTSCKRITKKSVMVLAIVFECIIEKILNLSFAQAKITKKSRLTPRHVLLAIRKDEELSKLFQDGIVAQGGVLPNIHTALLPKLKKSSKHHGSKK